jgi:glycosyltransferase involved in cell wall biosynthesis
MASILGENGDGPALSNASGPDAASLDAASLDGAAADGGLPQTARIPTIMQVLPSLVTGGVERGAVDIAAALVKAGWRAVVVSQGGPMVRELERAGARHIALPVASKNPFTMHANVARIEAAIRETGADLVHARSRAPAWSARAAAKRARVPFVTTFHGTYNFATPFKRLYNAIMAKGVRVIAISDFIARHAIENYGVSPAVVRVVHRGIDLAKFDPARVSVERQVKLAREWRLPDGLPVVMLPGRLTRWKGQTLLIDAVAKLGRRDMALLLVGADQGRTAYRAELERRVRARGLEGIVRVVDHCPDMPAAYMLADVVVSASTDPEAFGRVVAEAQAMGRPVVAPAHGAAPEILIEGKTGWTFAPGKVDALADALALALNLPAQTRQTLSQIAIEHVRANFAKERMSKATLDVYAEVLRESRPEVWK